MFSNVTANPIKNLRLQYPNQHSCEVALKPEYLIHPHISGNKYRKLKYNLKEAKKQKLPKLLTFGGAYSNHIAAVAAAGLAYGFTTVGIIRGEELAPLVDINPTLKYAKACGMVFKFVPRELYREKNNTVFIQQLKNEFGEFFLLPEGGTNELAILGCQEILNTQDLKYDFICCSVGTGGTISGIINSSNDDQKILGFPALKSAYLDKEIAKFANKTNWELIDGYHFGGYAKINSDLVSFINMFKLKYNVPLDPIYTGKMLYGIFDLIDKGYFPAKAKILAIHTGGLQGIAGMNQILKQKQLPLIDGI